MTVGFCFALTLLGSAGRLVAKDPSSAELYAKRFEARYRSAKTLRATFLEKYAESGTVAAVESGTAYFKRPGKMRWEYAAPERNLYLVDGKNAWFYVPADHTVTKVQARASADFRTPLALLAGEMRVSRICDRVGISGQYQPEDSANVMLYCELKGADGKLQSGTRENGSPRGDAAFFEINRESGDLMRILVRHAGDVQVEFRFKDWQFDPRLPEVLFHFAVPKGVAIVDGNVDAEK